MDFLRPDKNPGDRWDNKQKRSSQDDEKMEDASAHILPETSLKVEESGEGGLASIAETKSYSDEAYVDNGTDEKTGGNCETHHQ